MNKSETSPSGEVNSAMSGMEITGVELFKVPPRWMFLKITTANGLSGWGEPVVEGRADTVAAAIKELESYLIGHPANRIEDLWQIIFRGGFYRGGPILMSAISGIDQALWDIKGKALGVPIYELLGGAVRDKMKIYGWIGGDKPHDVASSAIARVEAGFKAVKMNATSEMEWIDSPAKVKEAADRLAAVREAVGDEVSIGIDFHGRVHKGMFKVLSRAMEPNHPFFIEEPVLAENNEALRAFQSFTPIPIATGERMYSRWDFKQVFNDGSVDIIQPDLSHAGGISEVKKIASMAEAYDVALAPHCPLGPISFAAALQVDFSAINAMIQETSMGIHYNKGADLLDYLKDPTVFKIDNGYVPLPKMPGLGIAIDEEKVREASRIGHSWKNPVWRNEDGSITEW
ncbi:galactonate dehydratase [Fulvivirgaceae bacterium BMA12]|uniref:Galactonate dehydratase n=1 Tax=Agaribacillus aureus TaxID=3051825 RepID=A0ABT8LBQ9_9BACT|nr:galactonate dehydratase [Fulvivirgaceae bacterium BMA12]